MDSLPLTPRENAVLALKAAGFSYKEIAEKLGMSIAAVNQRYSRAMLKKAQASGATRIPLSPRELQTLRAIESGVCSYAELMDVLDVSFSRVKALVWSLKRKGWLKQVSLNSTEALNENRSTF